MAECSSVENSSEDVFDFVCGPCNVDGEILQAKGYCSDCQDYLCDLCFKTHIRPKPLRHHVLLDEKTMPKNKKATTDNKTSDICTERCEKHSGNIIEYYCQRHDFVGCTKCFISDNHRKCEGVICIEDTAHGIFHSQEFTNFERTVKQLANVLSESSLIQQQNDENIKIYSIRANQDIKNFRANMNEYLDRLENEMDKQVSQMKDRQTSQLMSTSKQIENFEKNIKAIQETIERTRHMGQKSNLYIYMKRNSDQLKLLEDRIETVKKDGEVSEYTFTPDGYLLGQKAKTFGTLVIKENDKYAEVKDDIPELPEWTYERQLVQLSLEEKGRLPELGTRVKRGADWKWGNEDGNGSGTIVGHKDNGCVYMVWDNMKMGLYRYGLENAYDLDKDLTPRYVRLGDIEIGCWVIRGPEWTYDDEDGGVGAVGVVVRKLPDRYVQVRWPSRVFGQYKFGADNKWDLEITLEPPHSAGVPVYTGGSGQNNRGTGQTAGGAYNTEETQGQQEGETFVPEKYEIIWKWEDFNKQGRIFSEEAIKKMENGYQTLKGKFFVQSNGKNIKVYIDYKEGKMECEIDGKRRPIMREVLLEAEVLTLREVEKFM